MDREFLKTKAVETIDAHRDELIQLGRDLFDMPETGFKEVRTAAYIRSYMKEKGLCVEDGIAVTGIRAILHGKRHNRRVAVLGEMDALLLPSHPHADTKTGAAHACGHSAQVAVMLGVLVALADSDIMGYLDGDVIFLAVPAEEAIEFEYRKQLQKEGRIIFSCGKQEFIRLGMFDDVDAVISGHLADTGNVGKFRHSMTHNGMVSKTLHFRGLSAHAGMQPESGINALQAAVNAINNINAMRESFDENEKPRVHFIITKGGDSPNIIPDDVQMEMSVRAATLGAMERLDSKVDIAIRAGAESVGAEVEIYNSGLYIPSRPDRTMNCIFAENAKLIAGLENVIDACNVHRGSSTDVGDVASILPYCYFNFGGASGKAHTVAFDIVDEQFAYIESAKAAAMTVIDLLADDCDMLNVVRNNYLPIFASKEDYLSFCSEKLGIEL